MDVAKRVLLAAAIKSKDHLDEDCFGESKDFASTIELHKNPMVNRRYVRQVMYQLKDKGFLYCKSPNWYITEKGKQELRIIG